MAGLRGGCVDCPAGGPRPVQPDGRCGRDQGGAERDHGDLPARDPACGDHAGGRRLIWRVVGL